jgi:hypothetical protein
MQSVSLLAARIVSVISSISRSSTMQGIQVFAEWSKVRVPRVGDPVRSDVSS